MSADLIAIVGEENVLSGNSKLEVCGVQPGAIAAPGDRAEAAEVIRLAVDRGWGVVPFGAGTQMSLGNPPSRYDLALSTSRLNQIIDYQPDDMTITVEPGVTLQTIDELLASRGQFLPLNPPHPERATVGGTIASASYGSWCAGFGTPRDWLIGCRVVGVDGKEIRGGGQVVKNVAGYDLPKLYTGSFGTLGLLTELTFKVMPIPGISGYCMLDIDTPEVGEKAIAAIRDSDLQPSALELIGGSSRPWQLFVQLLHVPEAIEWQVEHLTGIASKLGAGFTRISIEEGTAALNAHRDAPAKSAFVARIGTQCSRTAELAARAATLCQSHGPSTKVIAHAANGRIHVMADNADGDLCRELRSLAAEAKATCLFPRLPVELIGEVDPWGPLGPEAALMQGVKRAYDPNGVFCPGRFVGGL